MLVKDIMSSGLKTVSPDTPIMEVASLMCLYRYSGLPVVENDQLVGIIAEKDLLSRLFPSLDDIMAGGVSNLDFDSKIGDYRDIMNHTVNDLMHHGATTVPPDMPILKAAVIMAKNQFRRIPVAEGKTLVGMLSLGDVHKAIFNQALISNS